MTIEDLKTAKANVMSKYDVAIKIREMLDKLAEQLGDEYDESQMQEMIFE